ncbi:1123_t:CDS:10 [Paraglomus brasilianum]|uniref:1123_t:CDS:1 n=1 Tax=Paraglomus brasilianum TaxID=144538 RepID=A0A9N9EYZ2_9GLOM|nr:1123_t:CDS:10 [Paraglomus brasilianum]
MPKVEHFTASAGFPVYCTAFNPAGELLVGGGGGQSSSGVQNKLALYKVDPTAKKIEQLTEYKLEKGEDAPMSMAIHPEDNVVACGINGTEESIKAGENYNCRIFNYYNEKIDLVDKKQTSSSTDPEDYLKVIRFSKDGKLLALGGTDSKLTVYKYPSLAPAFPPINYNKETIYDLDFSSDGKQITALSEKTLGVWATEDGKLVQTIERPVFQKTVDAQFRACRYGQGEYAGFLYVVVNPSNRRRAFIVKWDIETWNKVASKTVASKPITTFAISNDGKYLAYGSSDLSVGICDSRNLRVLLRLSDVHSFSPTTIVFNHSSSVLVSGSIDSVHLVVIPKTIGQGNSFLAVAVITLLFGLAILLALIMWQML